MIYHDIILVHSSFGPSLACATNTGPLLGVIVGVVALVASTRIKEEAIAMVIAVLGFLAGGLGGVLVAIGGIWAIISRYTLKAHT